MISSKFPAAWRQNWPLWLWREHTIETETETQREKERGRKRERQLMKMEGKSQKSDDILNFRDALLILGVISGVILVTGVGVNLISGVICSHRKILIFSTFSSFSFPPT